MIPSIRFFFALAGNLVHLATLALGNPQDLTEQCCGYVVRNRNNAFYRYRHVVDFSTSSLSEIRKQGWRIADGEPAGAVNPITKQKPIGHLANVQIVKGQGLALKVPRQQKGAASFSVAQVQFPDAVLGGIFEAEVKLTSEPGTCMGLFTYHVTRDEQDALIPRRNDEQDIEMLGASLLTTQKEPYQAAGMQMTFYKPSSYQRALPKGIDPSKGYHTYSISWYPETTDNTPKPTEIRFDGKLVNAPKAYSSVNPSSFIINHWTNADAQWSAGPPARDAIMYVKKFTAYYDKPAKLGSPEMGVMKGSCDRASACKVTV